jgi:hypothetical protein
MSFRRGATVGQDVPGGLHNDQSFKVSGSGNTVNFAPDNSIHDNRTYSEYELYLTCAMTHFPKEI